MQPSLPKRLILASQSPRRRELLTEAGYKFEVISPGPFAECGICSRETPPEMVARLARQKAGDVAASLGAKLDASVGNKLDANVGNNLDANLSERIVIGCDTVAECCGHVLGKPKNRDHAREMLQMMRGREHSVYSGLCLWHWPQDEIHVQVDRTRLKMVQLPDSEIESYLDTDLWEGKAGAFGLQDRLGWIDVVDGSESNVVGLPMELLERMLKD